MNGFDRRETASIVCLDSNVWRYLSDHGAGGLLNSLARHDRLVIAAAPAVLYEALRTSNPEVRSRLVRLITHHQWMKLMPEAFLESEELFYEIRRVRPQWIKQNTNLRYRNKLIHDWKRQKGGTWHRARFECEDLREYLNGLECDQLTRARHQVRNHREVASSLGRAVESVRLDAEIKFQVDELDVVVEAWRACTFYCYTKDLCRLNSTFVEWLQPLVQIKQMLQDPDWVTFWHQETQAANLPRAWIRYAMEQLTPFLSVNDGTPCDTQIASYCADSDYFITADKRFFRILEICRKQAPFSMAEPILFKYQDDIHLSIETSLMQIRKSRGVELRPCNRSMV
ncbi:MAG: hypothetical protein KME02_07030 [Aphanothece saxicola GSE-SYN-MK-01-06B]|jgi:hypothetical protein|nr:hypothetical protein [Aphanothece saxicola GSE-SYN-MK-01-06B]